MAMSVIPLRSPKQNGYVERYQRIWRKEFYETSSVATTLDEYSRVSGTSWLTAAMSGLMPHGVE